MTSMFLSTIVRVQGGLAQSGFRAVGVSQSPVDRLRAMSEHWGSGDVMSVKWIAVAGTVVGLGLGLLVLVRWWRQRHDRPKPMAVFHQVAEQVGLGLADQWLLVRIARQQALPSPLTLLLSPRTLRHHAQRYARQCRPRRRRQVMWRIAAIRRSLFGPSPTSNPTRGASPAPSALGQPPVREVR